MKMFSQSFEATGVQSASRDVSNFSAPFQWRTILTGLGVFVGYYIGAKIGFALTFRPHPVSVLWPPNSVLVAALLLTAPRSWWLILVFAFPAHWAAQLQSHVPPLMISSWFLSNSCEALIGAGLTRYILGGPIDFRSLRNVGIFCVCAAFIGPFLSSFLDAAFVVWNGWGADSYWELIRVRLSSNILAALIVVPLIVTWATEGILVLRTAGRARWIEGCVLLLGLLSVSFVALYKLGSGADPALIFLPLPFLIWAAVRFGALGASTTIAIVGFLAIWSASHGHGPFSGGTSEQNALSIQMFLIVLSIPVLLLASVIEERATREMELRESESRFRVVADAAPVLVWMSGPDKLCTFFNKAWLEFTGRTMEQELGNGWSEGVHPDDLQECLRTYVSAFDARESFTMQYRLRNHDGAYRWTSDRGVPRYDAHGDFVGYIGACVDLTELLKREQELHQFEERVTLAAQAGRFGVWEMDMSTHAIWMSDSARNVFEFDSETPITHELLQGRVHTEDRAFREAVVKQAIETHSGYEIEYRAALPDGTVRWIGGRARCVRDETGKLTRLLGVSADITARKKAEEEAQLRREEMSRLSHITLLGEMTASIAHELNQPLSGIIANASAGQRFIDRGNIDVEMLREILVDIGADGRRAHDVIQNIRNTIKKGETFREPIDLNFIVTKVARMLQSEMAAYSCELETSLAKDLPMVDADPVQIHQVLINLVTNAREAMRDASLPTRKVQVATQRNGHGSIEVSVRDYGAGIPEAIRDRLFEQFFTTKEDGLGMGLAIVRSIIEGHGGKIEAENIEGGGARFSFILPVSNESLK
jgi:two-component system, LuxR family, sensor kinase FixL